MATNWNEIRARANVFARDWASEAKETAEYQTFWNEFFEVFGVRRRTVARYQERVEKIKGNTGFIDLYWPNTLIAEHKSAGQNLDSAYEQAGSYFDALEEENRPRYIIVTDYRKVRFYDLEADGGKFEIEFELNDFPKHIRLFGFIAGFRVRAYKEEDPINVKAVQAIGRLYEAVRSTNYPQDKIDRLLTRLVFCFFADDTGVFNKDTARNYLEENTSDDGTNVGSQMSAMFQILNTPLEQRASTLDDSLAALPYVNGGLFAEPLPALFGNRAIRDALIKAASFDWSGVSPAIFGSMFQSVLDDKTRHDLGAHYTSEKNILKVINSLFLDELYEILEKAKTNHSRLDELWSRISKIKLLDPACGCGNFLVVSYRELRRLELEIIKRKYPDDVKSAHAGQAMLDLGFDVSKLSKFTIESVFGIEIETFAAEVARLSLWLIDHLANVELGDYFGEPFAKLPLTEQPHIVTGNALRMDWNDIVSKSELTYILGNPPFISKQDRDDVQKEDMEIIFGKLKGAGELDYVAAWYKKAVDYIQNSNIEVAFVSTNSISQGEQVGILWQEIFASGARINFAHRTFKWTNEAPGKAAVHCVVVGFSLFDRQNKNLFDYENLSGEPHVISVANINPYLVSGPNVFITSRRAPLSKVPNAVFGSMPNDSGQLLFADEEEKNEFLKKEPGAEKFIRPLISAKEYFQGGQRYCLWLRDFSPDEWRNLPEIVRRVNNVKQYRELSTRPATQKLAETPFLFGEDRQPDTKYALIPRVSSERRSYVPLSFFEPNMIAGDTCIIIPDATIYHFGILQSVMHMAWMRQICGRMKSDYRYSNELVYNNFPWPENVSEEKKIAVEKAAQAVLDVRVRYPKSTLADLYDPNTTPKDLNEAHKALDRAVDKCYSSKIFKNETDRLEFLFDLYKKIS